MDQVIKFYNESRKGNMTTCAAIRATVKEFIDVPRGELAKVLIDQVGLNQATVRTQIQLGRKQANEPAEAPKAATAPTGDLSAAEFAKAKGDDGFDIHTAVAANSAKRGGGKKAAAKVKAVPKAKPKAKAKSKRK